MKRSKIIIPIAIFFILISLLMIFIFSLPRGKQIKNENYIDNSYNNSYLSDGNLARIGDKLYFNYNPDFGIFRYGLYEISYNNSKRIFWKGPLFEPENVLYKMQVFGNNLLASDYSGKNTSQSVDGDSLLTQFNGDIYALNSQENNFNKLCAMDNKKSANYKYYYVLDNKFYIFTDEKLYISTDGINVQEAFSNLSNAVNKTAYEKLCYIYKDKLFYISNDDFLIEYDLESNKEVYKRDLSELNPNVENFRDIFVCDNKIVITLYEDNSNFEVYVVDNDIEIIYQNKLEPYYYINCYNKNIFISSISNGLDVVNINTHKIENLVKSNVCDTYIIDDCWIYYVQKSGALMRTDYSVRKSEKVFG